MMNLLFGGWPLETSGLDTWQTNCGIRERSALASLPSCTAGLVPARLVAKLNSVLYEVNTLLLLLYPIIIQLLKH
jgi:hypothetical protein